MTYTALSKPPSCQKNVDLCCVYYACLWTAANLTLREKHMQYATCCAMCFVPATCHVPGHMLCADPPAKQKTGPKSRKRKAKEEDDADVQPTVSSTTNKQKAAPYKLPEVHLAASLHQITHKCHRCANTNTASAAFRLRSLKFALQKLFVVQSDTDCWWIRLTNGFDTCKHAITLQPHALQDDITDACILYGSCKLDKCSLLSHADSL